MTIVIYPSVGGTGRKCGRGDQIAAHYFTESIPGIGLRIIFVLRPAIAVLALVYPHNRRRQMDKVPFCMGILPRGHSGGGYADDAGDLFRRVFLPLTRPFTPVRVCCGSWRARYRFAPACFCKTNGGGVPVYAIFITALLVLVSLLTRYIPAQQFYLYLIASTGHMVGCPHG